MVVDAAARADVVGIKSRLEVVYLVAIVLVALLCSFYFHYVL